MSRITGADIDIQNYGVDLCATWSAISNLQDGFQKVCNASRTLVICDEHHHAAVKAAWGDGADSAFTNAKYVLVLTGTPMRSDGNETIWLAFDDKGQINQHEGGMYTLSYGEAVERVLSSCNISSTRGNVYSFLCGWRTNKGNG